ncbi:hypothetical protein TW85_23120, partial [Marinomonas sp. S3726]
RAWSKSLIFMLRTLSIESLLSCAPRHKSSDFYPHAEAGGLIRRLPRPLVMVKVRAISFSTKKSDHQA